MKKSINLLFLIAITISLIFAGISCKEAAPAGEAAGEAEGEEAAAGEEIVITMEDWQGGTGIEAVYDAIIENFEKDHPGVRVEHTSKTFTQYDTDLKTALTAGEAPDIFAAPPGPGVVEAAEAGALIDLTDQVMGDAEWLEWMGKSIDYTGMRHEGKLYVVAQDSIMDSIWYWKDMAEEAGITELPETLDDYAALLPKADAAEMQLFIAGFNEGVWVYVDAVSTFAYQQLEPGDEDMIQAAMSGKISWQQPELVNALNALKELFDTGVFTADALSFDYQTDTMNGFINREGIFGWEMGSWVVPAIPEEDRDKIGVLPWPLIDGSFSDAFYIGVGTDAGVYSKSEHQDLAVAFLKETYSPRSAQIYIDNGTTPPGELKEIPETDNPLFKTMLTMMMEADKFFAPYYSSPELNEAFGVGCGRVVVGEVTAEELLAELDAMME